MVFSQDSISVPDYENATILYLYDRQIAGNDNPASGILPLKVLKANGSAYITNTSGTFDHVTSDIQWTVPDDGFISIGYMLDYGYASDEDQATLRNGGIVQYTLYGVVKANKGYNGCGWWTIFSMNKMVKGTDMEHGADTKLIQVKKGNVVAFGTLWAHQSLPGAIKILYYPLKKTRVYD